MHGDRGKPGKFAPEGSDTSPLECLLIERIRTQGPITMADYMEVALYHPDHGYYGTKRERIGTKESTDFFTAYDAGNVFAELVVTSALNLLGKSPPGSLSWVEIGAERGRSLWETAPPPFRELVPLCLGDDLDLPPKSVVFSNELFDAQPFHRMRFFEGNWREVGVGTDGNVLFETLLDSNSAPVENWKTRLPARPRPDAVVDLSLGAVSLSKSLASRRWDGLFLAFDYGKRWEELVADSPRGTLRAYSRHRQNPDILKSPGKHDITGHICWDWMIEVLSENGFHDIALASQESFFVRNAASAIERIIQRRPGLPDLNRQRLHQLIHPTNMGQKFQVLSARRDSVKNEKRRPGRQG